MEVVCQWEFLLRPRGRRGPRSVLAYAGVVRVRLRDEGQGAEAADVLPELVQVIRGDCAGGGRSDGGAAAAPLPAEPDLPGPRPSPQPEVVMPASSMDRMRPNVTDSM